MTQNKTQKIDEHLERTDDELPERTLNVRLIPIEQITTNEAFTRSHPDDDLTVLAQHIRENGLLHYPIVREDKDGTYELIAGYRRLQSCRQLSMETIPCFVREANQQQAALLAFAENLLRKNPHPLDQARFLRSIKDDFGLKEREIAERLGLAQSGVSERLSILHLDEDIVLAIDAKNVKNDFVFTMNHAIQLAKVARLKRADSQDLVRKLFEKSTRYELSVKKLKGLVQSITGKSFVQLPTDLQDMLLIEKDMTPEMVQIYLEPEKVAGKGDGITQSLREAIAMVDADTRANLIKNAVKEGWQSKKMQMELLRLAKKQLEPTGTATERNTIAISTPDEAPTLTQFINNLHDLLDDLSGDIDMIITAAKANTEDFERLRHASYELQRKWEEFMKRIKVSGQEQNDKQALSEGAPDVETMLT